jgi:hypothetical protein
MLLIGVLAATLIGCSRQPPPQAAMPGKATLAWQSKKPAPDHARYAARLTGKAAKSTRVAAKTDAASRIPLPHRLSHVQAAGRAAAATSDATRANIAEPHPTIGVANTRPIQEQVAAATQVAERMTAATAVASPDIKASNLDKSDNPETATRGKGAKTASPPENNTDVLVALIMARPDIKSVSELTGKTIAIDKRYSASNSGVRTALVAAGAPEVQLSDGQTTAINRVVNGEVPAAVLALVSADAAESFPKIAAFRIFYIPLSPRSRPTGNLEEKREQRLG